MPEFVHHFLPEPLQPVELEVGFRSALACQLGPLSCCDEFGPVACSQMLAGYASAAQSRTHQYAERRQENGVSRVPIFSFKSQG
jgi:hypothetical protein